ncbi:glycosyltransferase [Candidatus Saccharibacteria bacterium]|nr:glycosyltransferase [Candidatus Saccharibacteria bacterium]
MRENTVTIILPCLNEQKTILECVKKINGVMKKSKYKNSYKILVCDNGSTDNSVKICKRNKIDYIIEKKRGYGNVILAGIKKASSKYIVMLDCDLSYNSEDIPRFISELKKGNDLVIGNRFKGEIKKGAMPLSHRIGSSSLSKYANLLFHTKAKDYHCGLRAFDRKKILKTKPKSSGFEFASEMIILAKLNKLKISEIKTDLFKDGRDRKPHLRTIRDGFRHLHEINKLKFKNSKIFRYLVTFLLSISAISLFSIGSCLIPHEAIKDNAVKSTNELIEIIDDSSKQGVRPYRRFEKYGDMRNYAMIFTTNENDPIRSAVEMNYPSACDILTACNTVLSEPITRLTSYNRYWQGQSSAIHYVTPFMSLKPAITFFTILFVILLLYTLYKVFIEDKVLSFALFIGLLAINISFVTRSLQFLPVMYLMLITILLVLRARKKNPKNLDIIFLISGVLTCYFDFLTCETVTLTVPLIVYVYLEIKAGKKVPLKKLILYSALWLAGYGLAFALKWFISFLFMGPESFSDTMAHMTSHTVKGSIFEKVSLTVTTTLSNLLPFAFVDNGGVYALIFILICLIYTIFEDRKRLALYAICLVPVARFTVVNGHSLLLNYFTYRALICIVIVISITIIQMIKNTIKNDNSKK